MAKLILALACQRVITDAETNNVSYIDVVENLATTAFPTVAPPVSLCTIWARETVDELLRIRLIFRGPGGEIAELFENEGKMTHPRYRLNLTVAGYKVSQPGEVQFVIEVGEADGWTVGTTIVIPVVAKEPVPTE